MSQAAQYKVVVAHPGRQHSLQTAVALKHGGALCIYVTTIYPDGQSILMNVAQHFLPSGSIEKLRARCSTELSLSDVQVYCELSGMIEALLNRVDKSGKVRRWWHDRTSDRFGRKVAKLAIGEQVDAVIMYDTTALSCFEYLENRAPYIRRVMDPSHANRLYLREIYKNEADTWSSFSDKIHAQLDYLWGESYANRLQAELDATQFFLAPSTFVAKSLEFSGIPAERIKLCPYGSNFEPLKSPEPKQQHKKLQALFVGNVTELKGVQYLLAVAEELVDTVEVTLVGAYDNSDHVFDPYLQICSFVGAVPHDEVRDYMQQADVFVFPSLGEGLSLSVLEAMACGLPCIVSTNSGANDAIEEGVNGFVIEAQNLSALTEKLLWCAENRAKLPQMGEAACQTAQKYSWEAYGQRLAEIMASIIEDGCAA